jgi:integrase
MKKKNHNLIKRSGTWYFKKTAHGVRIRKALSTNVTEARRLRDQYLDQLATHGRILDEDNCPAEAPKLFGEVARLWADIQKKRLKSSTFKDYRSAMNYYILDHFGNRPIANITFLEFEAFIAKLSCSNKRINNLLVPMRSVYKMALKAGYIEKDPMALISNLKTQKPEIQPLSMEEVRMVIDAVSPRYKAFFIIAFFTGMRFGEMAALKWRNVDFKLGVVKIRETLVDGEEGRPKTSSSVRDIKMLPPVVEAFRDQRKATMGKSDYVFLNYYGRTLFHHSVNIHTWKPALAKCDLRPRPLYQTRHTFATLMLDAGEQPGWVARMMGHTNLKMIHERYYSYIKNYQRDDGAAFMAHVYQSTAGVQGDLISSTDGLKEEAVGVR